MGDVETNLKRLEERFGRDELPQRNMPGISSLFKIAAVVAMLTKPSLSNDHGPGSLPLPVVVAAPPIGAAAVGAAPSDTVPPSMIDELIGDY